MKNTEILIIGVKGVARIFSGGAPPFFFSNWHSWPCCGGTEVWVDPVNRETRLTSQWQLTVDEARQLHIDIGQVTEMFDAAARPTSSVTCVTDASVLSHSLMNSCVCRARLTFYSCKTTHHDIHKQWLTGRTVSCLDHQSVKVVLSVIKFWCCCLFLYVNGWLLSIISLRFSVFCLFCSVLFPLVTQMRFNFVH